MHLSHTGDVRMECVNRTVKGKVAAYGDASEYIFLNY